MELSRYLSQSIFTTFIFRRFVGTRRLYSRESQHLERLECADRVLAVGAVGLIGDTFSDGELNDDEVLEDSVNGDRECSIRRFDHCIKHQVWSRNKKVVVFGFGFSDLGFGLALMSGSATALRGDFRQPNSNFPNRNNSTMIQLFKRFLRALKYTISAAIQGKQKRSVA